MFKALFSTQQLYEVPFFVQEVLPKYKFLKVAFLYVQEQFQYHDFLSEVVVLTHAQVEFWQNGI